MKIMDKINRLLISSNRESNSVFDIAYVIEENIPKINNIKSKEPNFFEIIKIYNYSIVFQCSYDDSDKMRKIVLNIDKNDVLYISETSYL